MKNRNSILDYYQDINGSYLHAHGERGTEHLLQKLDLHPGEKVLEIGFGTGATLVKIISRYPFIELFGVETSSTMLEKARSRLQFCGVTTKIALSLMPSIDRLNFEDDSFDKIYVESVLAIQEDSVIVELLREIYRILKPGGKVVMNETLWLPEIIYEEIAKINTICKSKFGIIQSTGKYKTWNDWSELLKINGFELLRFESIDSMVTLETRERKHWQEWLSRLFSIIGLLSGMIHNRLRSERKEYTEAMKDIFENKKYMEGYLIIARK
ncbi:MAG: class I SAM-dependent methyltransferase [Bacteroidota bacterium]